MKGFIILAIIGTEKLIVTEVDGLPTDGMLTDKNSNSYIALCYKQLDKNNRDRITRRFKFIQYAPPQNIKQTTGWKFQSVK